MWESELPELNQIKGNPRPRNLSLIRFNTGQFGQSKVEMSP